VAGTCWYPVDLLQAEGAASLGRIRLGEVEQVTIRVGPYPYPVQELTVEDSMVNLSDKDLARAKAEAQQVAALWDRRGPRRFTLPLHPPLRQLSPGRSFGARRIFNGEPRSPHSGVDFRGAAGTPVLAAAAGRVALAASHFFPGNSVFIDHGGGLISMYFHLDTMTVAEGEEVDRGQVIGTVGSTGRSTGPHLHFGVRWHGARIDPNLLLGPVEATPAVR
jgi:murein DD-endopeptidase MepM/ murein hydrolase activator NlpD